MPSYSKNRNVPGGERPFIVFSRVFDLDGSAIVLEFRKSKGSGVIHVEKLIKMQPPLEISLYMKHGPVKKLKLSDRVQIPVNELEIGNYRLCYGTQILFQFEIQR